MLNHVFVLLHQLDKLFAQLDDTTSVRKSSHDIETNSFAYGKAHLSLLFDFVIFVCSISISLVDNQLEQLWDEFMELIAIDVGPECSGFVIIKDLLVRVVPFKEHFGYGVAFIRQVLVEVDFHILGHTRFIFGFIFHFVINLVL